MRTYEESLVGNNRIVFVCIQNEKDIYEIKYELDSRFGIYSSYNILLDYKKNKWNKIYKLI